MTLELLTSVALGLGLSAACGLRVFVPLLLMSLAGLNGFLRLDADFAWIASYPALAVFGSATLLEVMGYYIPWVDNLLDAVATPAALVAGTIASASVLVDVPPPVQWTLAVIAGGGAAGLIQTGTVAARGASSATTGGLGNPLIATLENVLAVLTTVFTLIVPLAAGLLVLAAGVLVGRRLIAKSQ